MVNDKKNTLILTPCMPDENGHGAHKRAAAHINAISKIRNVYLIIFQGIAGDPLPMNKSIADLCQFIKVIPAQLRPRKTLSSLPPFTILSEIITPQLKRMIPKDEILKQVMAELEHIAFEEAFCYRIRTANILEQILKVTSIKVRRKIVDFDDIQSILTTRLDAGSTQSIGFEQSVINKIQLRRLKKLEKKILRIYPNILVCSHLDKDKLLSIHPKANINIVPNRVPLNEFSLEQINSTKKQILFVGTLSYAPNEDGILWFFKKIYPIIQEKAKVDLSLYIVGFEPSKKVLDLEKNNDVIVTGGVESVVPYYEQCNIVIAPIRMGGGTRIKILEAMSYNRAVISTTIGAEGLEVENEKDIIIADSPDAFANACIKLIENNNYRSKISASGRKTVEDNYNNQKIDQILCQLFE